MNAPTVADQTTPPSAPIAGQTQQFQSVQPESNPPVVTDSGPVYRTYSVQPRGSSNYNRNNRPQDQIINRHLNLHPNHN